MVSILLIPRSSESTHKGVNQRSKYAAQVQQRPESPDSAPSSEHAWGASVNTALHIMTTARNVACQLSVFLVHTLSVFSSTLPTESGVWC